MNKNSRVVAAPSAEAAVRRGTAGDAVVDGLLAGLAGGAGMAVYLTVAGIALGEGPGVMMARFDPAGSSAALTGLLMHLAVSAVYGLLFGALYRLVGRGRLGGRAGATLVGLAYGLALFLVAQGLLSTDAGAMLRTIPAVHFAVAHGVYGLTAGWLMGRSRN